MTKLIIFDFDGTLANSLEVFLKGYNELALEHGYKKVEACDIDALSKMSIPDRCRYLGFPMRNIPLVATKLYRHVRQSKESLQFFPGIKEMLTELKSRGYELAIISSNATDIIESALESNQMNYFDEILCSKHIFTKDKMIKKLLKKTKTKTSEAIYVGDEERDIIACKKAGVRVIWAEWGYDDEEVALKALPDFTASSPDGILTVLA
ncbi:phosphoglycolate phosphatase [Bacillus ectoiniformans]|uniref:HAD-IA family hydrolase n=1 Tax=Bacillus ectoiniformans TaxID=1494429 RepID=UPI00195CED06|nr:HAD-IA family hydrolase [Bacillus ectoiniformans]MBM7649226.1 phosphoglycolate phosphatase [Bacillus ectoiniformans]